MGTPSDCRPESRRRLQDARLSLTSDGQVVSTSEMSCSPSNFTPSGLCFCCFTVAGRKQQDTVVQNAKLEFQAGKFIRLGKSTHFNQAELDVSHHASILLQSSLTSMPV